MNTTSTNKNKGADKSKNGGEAAKSSTPKSTGNFVDFEKQRGYFYNIDKCAMAPIEGGVVGTKSFRATQEGANDVYVIKLTSPGKAYDSRKGEVVDVAVGEYLYVKQWGDLKSRLDSIAHDPKYVTVVRITPTGKETRDINGAKRNMWVFKVQRDQDKRLREEFDPISASEIRTAAAVAGGGEEVPAWVTEQDD